MAYACKKSDALLQEFTAAPIYFSNGEAGGHEWLIEFEKAPNNLTLFTEALDEKLKAVNSDYEAKRFNKLHHKNAKNTNCT